MKFKLVSKFKPAGDQEKAIKKLVEGIKKGKKRQTLLGITGSGKTFVAANVIEKIQKPVLVISHNKTLAAQLCNEFRAFFPENSVHYFVSYYDYYQPEAYMPNSDTYIGKEAMINEEIDRLRHAATTALLTRKDVIVVSSVSCIYDLGLPSVYKENIFKIKKGDKMDKKSLVLQLLKMQLQRSAVLKRGTFRVRGDSIQIMPPNEEVIYDFEIKEGEVSDILVIDPVLGLNPEEKNIANEIFISPLRHFLSLGEMRELALKNIKEELKERLQYFEKEGKLLEAERLEQRTKNDIAMIKELGYCNGIENYSRHLSLRKEGEPPSSLLEYFGNDYLTIIDESHVTIPQIGAMFGGNASRKKNLIDFGFRLPSSMDNRPLSFKEFEQKINNVIYASATPGPYEKKKSQNIVEQIIRPTGLIDPKITVFPAKTQISDLVLRILEKAKKKERSLVTALTKKMAEDLTSYFEDLNKDIKVAYIHSDIKPLDRIKILTGLRKGIFDLIIGVNLLREGLDLPEVSLVAILDADKEGFLRSETSLIQTIGRAARNVKGEVIIYADSITSSIKKAISETNRRRKMQIAYNKKHNIIPKSIEKEITDILLTEDVLNLEMKPIGKSKKAVKETIEKKEEEMRKAAKILNFELAAILRDEIKILKKKK
ncbi:MAG: excinuclease ABC subunit UvrB [Candidatus Pacebacteria bacterium]|nr:excinuclease ABC subunit UvrB [Candidatus Paceibacterota bacterium]MDD3729221.1 excinuclease ABC subunit UvrB [Candidatus Paceibacterota bacterium]MDD4201691.1 excinuclease ABC subunit UvrB [Candidatus Paceibacterota bacterium]MDD5445993.1 excinuclease ABC subunit UvrB [Candidatus Paceibacterota bacterium]